MCSCCFALCIKKKEVETITPPIKMDFLNINCRKKINPGFPERESFPQCQGEDSKQADHRRKFYSE